MQLTPIINARNEKKKKKKPLYSNATNGKTMHAAMLSHNIQWLEETDKRDLLKELYNI